MRNLYLPVILVLSFGALTVAAQETESDEPTPLAEAESLIAGIEIARGEIKQWEGVRDRYQGDDRRAVELELMETRLRALSSLHQVVSKIVQMEDEGLDAASLRQQVDTMMKDVPVAIRGHLEDAVALSVRLRARRDGATSAERVKLENLILHESDRINRISQAYLEHVHAMESLGLDTTDERDWLVVQASMRAEFLTRRIEITLERRSILQELAKARPDDPELINELSAVDKRLDGDVEGMRAVISIMTELDLDTAVHQASLVQATGEITDIIETGAALRLAGRLLKDGGIWVQENGARIGFKAGFFLFILAIFWIVAKLVHKLMVRALKSSRVPVSKLLEKMLTSMVRRILVILGVLVALSQIGVSIGPLLAGLGVAGFIVGFALQDVLSNFASGVMILLYRPFDVDDFIEVGGVSGKVNRMTLVSTTILTFDHQTLVIPNTKIWGDVIRNVTAQTRRRVDLTFGISYQGDIAQAEKVLGEVLKRHPKILDDPAPKVKVNKLGESSVDLLVMPWVNTDDYWNVYWDLMREVKIRFDEAGIQIPFPQRDVHIHQVSAAAT